MPGTVLSIVLHVYINPQNLRSMCHVYPHCTGAVIGVQGHFVIKGTLRIQTQAVWLPKILIRETKEE